MSDLTALLLVVIAGPAMGLLGMLLLGRPYDISKLTMLYGRFALKAVGLYQAGRVSAEPSRAPSLPSAISGFIDRICEDPRSLPLAGWSLRLAGMFWLILSMITVVFGVASFISD